MSDNTCLNTRKDEPQFGYSFRVTPPDSNSLIDHSLLIDPSLDAAKDLPDRVVINITEPVVFEEPSGGFKIETPDGITICLHERFPGENGGFDRSDPNYRFIDDVVYNSELTELYFCPRNKTSIKLPDTVKVIAEYAFDGCTKIENIVLPDGLISICKCAFNACTNLRSIFIPKSVNCIENFAFLYCDKLTEIIVDNANPYFSSKDEVLYSKETGWLIYCNTNKEHLILPEGIKDIYVKCFEKCNGMKKITLPSSLKYICFWSSDNSCTDLTDIIVDENNPCYSSYDGVLYNKNNTELIRCPKAKEAIHVSDRVKNIGVLSFFCCRNIKTVILPEGLESIDKWAFKRCIALENVLLPDTLNGIGGISFWSCYKLESVNIPRNVKNLHPSAFNWCINLKEINISEQNPVYKAVDGIVYSKDMSEFIHCPSGKESAVILDNTKKVGSYAFCGGKKLKSIYIPDSVEEIDPKFLQAVYELKHISVPTRLAEVVIKALLDNEYK